MSRYAIVTINQDHKDGLEWRDGERHTFYHGGEFEASDDEVVKLVDELQGIGKLAVTLLTDSKWINDIGFSVAHMKLLGEGIIDLILGRPADPNNPSVYVLAPGATSFSAGDTFTIGELSLASVDDGGILKEVNRIKLRSSHSESIHAIDRMS